MPHAYQTGLQKTAVYYGVSALVVALSYLAFPWTGEHLPGIPMFLLMLSLLGGGFWALVAIIFYLGKEDRPQQLGVLTIHLFLFSAPFADSLLSCSVCKGLRVQKVDFWVSQTP